MGTFYDLKRSREGKATQIGRLAGESSFSAEPQDLYRYAVNGYIRSGWDTRRLDDYYVAPKKKYTQTVIMPPSVAPEAFGVADQVENPSYWICHYQGQVLAGESGCYRFWGAVVRIGRKVVLDGSWPETIGALTKWKGSDDDNRRFPVNEKNYGRFKGGDFMEVFENVQRRLATGEGFSGILGEINSREMSVDGPGLGQKNPG